ncbi:MAG: CbiX/SirB N-terminal domain-containing protein [Betaproteobacteria bacterium]
MERRRNAECLSDSAALYGGGVVSAGLILFAHGARDERWAEPFERLRDKVAAARPGAHVRLAFLEIMRPDLGAAVTELVSLGCNAVQIAPVFLGQGGHVRRDLPELVRAVGAQHRGVTLILTQAVGEDERVLDAIAAVCLAGLPA